MITQTLPLSEHYPEASLVTYLHDNAHCPNCQRPAMIVCPGGGYSGLSSREAEPIALAYLNAGMNAFVLYYGVKEHAANYAPLIQAAMAIRHVREHAEEYAIDPNKIFVVGFSAGGHLAASAGILWNAPVVREALGITAETEGINRPNGMILSYPVISGFAKAHQSSIYHLCGTKEPTDKQRAAFSLDLHVDETTCPAFIWHTFSDELVPVENSLLLMNAMAQKKVPFEAHIFPVGQHGLALSTEETGIWSSPEHASHTARWLPLSIEWASLLFQNS
ncbi:MAG: alpha/beta hydrolase [Clostridia bacterium]|nr:alpha/beta hydrolase [Clostridia bacterium]